MSVTAQFLRDRARESGFVPNESVLLECVHEVRKQIASAAEQSSLTPRDYACTFLGAVSTATQSAIVQIGDGGVVVDVGDGLVLPISPMSGEYANMTYFITDDDALERVQSRVFPVAAQKVAVFTDGIQRLAVNMSTNTPHEPFFASFFQILAKATLQDEEGLHDSLHAFLASERVNERTDDDRTLVLAMLLAQ